MPAGLRLAGWGVLGALLLLGTWAWATNGAAILLDLAVGAAGLLCL